MPYARSFSFIALSILALLIGAGIASAQTTSYVPPAAYSAPSANVNATTNSSTGSVLGASTTDPNVPNTGAGGDAAANAAMLALSSFAVAGGAFLLRKNLAA